MSLNCLNKVKTGKTRRGIMQNLESKELVVVLGPNSLVVGSNAKSRILKRCSVIGESLKEKRFRFTPNFWQKRPSPLWTTQTRIAGLALSAPSMLENLEKEEVYFPTIDALVEVIKKVHQVKFILYATPFKSKEFSAYWNDTETLALVLPRYLEKYGVTETLSETIFVSDLNNEAEVSKELERIINKSSIFNVQDAPPVLTYALTKRLQSLNMESEYIWLQNYDYAELGRDIPIYPA
jgi:hypothetical protein